MKRLVILLALLFAAAPAHAKTPLEELRASFNAHADSVRVITLLAPT